MKIALITDAWAPQTNGVARTLGVTVQQLRRLDHEVLVIEPGPLPGIPLFTYPEIKLALLPGRRVHAMLDEFAPQAVHIATEGTIGAAARAWCIRHRFPFTTSYHTQYPEYVRARMPLPLAFSYAVLRRYHGAAERTMVATPTMQRQLEARGFRNIARWTRGVDLELFRPGAKDLLDLPRPIHLYMGRVAVEKNIEDFLRLDVPGSLVVVGDGPARARLQAQYPRAVFTGYKFGAELVAHLNAADVFVFPSRTDTFGLVLLEAMACGVPVAAYPVTGPIDVVKQGVTGILDQDLARAVRLARELSPQDCREYAELHSWENATQQFVANLAVAPARAASCTVSQGSLARLEPAVALGSDQSVQHRE